MAKIKLKKNINYSFLIIVFLLFGYGLAVLYSASTVESYKNFGNTTWYIYHQAAYGGLLGLVAMFLLAKIDYHFWQKQLPILLISTLALLFMVKLSHFGFGAGGAVRWIDLGYFVFQPSELAKLVIIFYIASWTDKKGGQLNDFYFGLFPSLVIVVLFAGLILWQPDLGTMFIVLGVSFVMLFAAGVDWKYFFWGLLAGSLVLYSFIRYEPYRARRLTTFLDPSLDPKGIGYHINQALLAIGSGKFWGYGYGLSRQKHNYLPEVMNDSIFAVLAEELGFLGVVALLVLLALFALIGISIAKKAPDTFGKMTALGITFWITLQALVNIGAMANLLPLTGIPLPFFSYGSTSLLLNLSAMGIVLNISKQGAA